MATRFAVIIFFLVGAYFLLGYHLYQLQIVKGDYYYARAESEALAAQGLSGNRGSIYFTDESGNLLPAAVEQPFPFIYVVPTVMQKSGDVKEAANTVSPLLNMPVSTLISIFSRPGDSYELLERKADPSVAEAISQLGAGNKSLSGIYADTEPERFYPLGTVASQVLGYVGPNATSNGESGYYGIEQFYNTSLAAGNDIALTIDPNIQIEAEKILSDLVTQNNATGGSIVVLDPRTGKVLAMTATPDFDPNNYGASPVANFLNPAVQSVYEPGSIFKVLTMAACIDAGKITPSTTYDDKGYVDINGAHITNYDLKTHGPYGPGITMTQVIEHSINTGAIYAENQIGNTIFTSYMKKFGLDAKTGIDLPGEVVGDLSELNPRARQVDFDTAAYGQGVAVTPIELITAVGAIANGGVMMRPYVNAVRAPKPLGRIVGTSTAAQVTQMMVDAVDLAGVTSINGYSLAGKTGSAFIPDFVHGGYTNSLIDSYIGLGPASNPRFIGLIRLNALPVTSLAAESVVPAFKELSQYIINYYNIPPDRPTLNGQ